jgi:hypothetical protein
MAERRDPDGVTVMRIEQGLGVLALFLLALVIVSSVSRPHVSGDSWAYHLPFSARLWNIGGDASTFALSNELEPRFAGFPLLAEFLQGALWRLTGSINAITLLNSGGLLLFIVVAGKSLRVNLALLVFSTLSVPLVALHALSSYIDLFVALCVCFQALAAERVAVGYADVEHAHPDTIPRWEAIYVAAAAAAGNSKVTGFLLSATISAFMLGYVVWRRKALPPARLRRIALTTLIAALAAGGTMLKNTYRFSNPVYPTTVSVLGVQLPGPEHQYSEYPTYTESLGPIARPVNWLLSITEIDRKIRGVHTPYAPDSYGAGSSVRYGRARTGGYWGSLMIGTLLLAFVLVIMAARKRSKQLARHAFFLSLFACVTLVGSFLPQSHELRYYLYWPVLLMVTVAILVRAAGLKGKARITLTLAYLGTLMLSQQKVAYPIRAWPLIPQHVTVAGQSSAPEIDFARRAGAICLGPEYNPRQFAYWSFFHGGDYRVEQGWSVCTRFPRYERSAARQRRE